MVDNSSSAARQFSQEEQFRLLVQGVTDYAIYLISPEGIVTSWNSGAQRIKGYEAEEIVGHHFSKFYTLEDRLRGLPERALRTAAESGRYEHEGLRVRKDGSTFWAHVIVDAITDKNGRIIGFGKVTRDVTEKRDNADALAVANAALFQSQKMEALGKLTGGIAHDFNNLLTVVTSGLEVLTAQYPVVEGARTLDSMRRALAKAAVLTQQLLSFARQEPLKTAVVELNTAIREFEPVLRRAGDSSIRYIFDLASMSIMVEIDAARFETTLLNLVVNACHAMPEGGQLKIKSRIVDLREVESGLSLPPGSYAQISVSDTGHGMTPEIRRRVFEPFFTTKELGKGTGLGLSQVYGFTTQSGGEIKVDSALELGTTFTLYFPLAKDKELAPTEETAMETVLIVDDQEDLLHVTSELFSALGYKTYMAKNGTEALEILESGTAINLLFSDIVMPGGISGVELARQVERRFPEIKIILSSGHSFSALPSAADELHKYAFISKPYQLADLAKKIRALH